jgi:glycosyltransferase involved in cell wall biosynthesis
MSQPPPRHSLPVPTESMATEGTQALVFGADLRRPWLAARSVRSLRAAGWQIVGEPEFAATPGPGLLLKAGEVLRRPAAARPPPVPNDRELVAIGLPCAGEWLAFQEAHGGDYSCSSIPPPVCEWHSCRASALARLAGQERIAPPRVVHWHGLDLVPTDERLVVWQVVTSLQHGGAERIARELALALPAHDIACRLVVLGKPHRRPLPTPPGTLDLGHLPRAERAAMLADHALAAGVDVFHLHLTNVGETRRLARSGIPVMATIHNTRAGWPQGWKSLQPGVVSLMLACSRAVEDELRETLPQVPVRTVWNGIQPNDYPNTPLPPTTAGFTLACVANPRPQKRLDRLPAILAATRAELRARGHPSPDVRLIIAGETAPDLAEAVASRAAVERAATAHGVADRIVWTEGRRPVREVLAEAHALVSCSAHEGLSLAHLEALSMGRPVVACDTGGTRELAWRNPAVSLLDPDASATEFARVLAGVLQTPPPSAHRWVWRDFTTAQMAARVAGFARQTACRPEVPGTTLWFVTNNLSTGGAQSSLRRLAKAIHRSGLRVRVALLQEYPEHPGPGRLDLLENGIAVFVPPPAGLLEPVAAVAMILSEMAADPPTAVVFWNAITHHKLLLAEALPFTPVHDISPGEMWFSSLAQMLANPPPGVPCRTAADYGRYLTTLVVKYAAEASRAAALGAPVRVIPNGVEVPPHAVRRDASGPALVFGTAARISPQKRLDELLAAFRLALPELPGAVLKIAGGVETGAEAHAESLRAMAADLPVQWLGESRPVAALHAACDVFVMISDPAGCPNASLEALAAGLPVVATDVGGAAEQVLDGVTGLLVQARDVPALARAMVAIATDPARRLAMGNAAREHIRRHFTLERMTADYLAVFF